MRTKIHTAEINGFKAGQSRALIVCLTCGSLVLVAAAWWYYLRQRETFESAVAEQLSLVADGKTRHIENWRRERLGDGRILESSALISLARRVLSSASAAKVDVDSLMDVMTRFSDEFLYTDAALVDVEGSVRLRLNEKNTPSAEARKRVRGQLARQAVEAREVQLSDLTLDTRDGRPMMFLSVPVTGLGALILDIDPNRYLYPLLEVWPGAGTTAESVLVRREGADVVYLSKRRLAPDAPLLSRRSITHLVLPPEEQLERGWFGRIRDYRDVPVIGWVRKIPGSTWYVVTKIDETEVSAPLRALAAEMAVITVLIAVASIAGVVLILKGERSRFMRLLSTRMIEAQEEERKRVARELHDDVNQQIGALSIAMGGLNQHLGEEQAAAREQSGRIHQKLVQLSKTIWRLSHELHPAVLQYSGLAAALRTYATEFAALTGIQVSIQIGGALDKVSPAVALSVYRIVQEGLQNVARHAKVDKASVTLHHRDGFLHLKIEDAGVGIDAARSKTRAGLGLVSIEERTRLVHGEFEIESKPDQGTVLTVKIPS